MSAEHVERPDFIIFINELFEENVSNSNLNCLLNAELEKYQFNQKLG